MRHFGLLIRACGLACFIVGISAQTSPSGSPAPQASSPAGQSGTAAAPSGGAAGQATPAAQTSSTSSTTAPAGSSGCVVSYTSPTLTLTPAQTSASVTAGAASTGSQAGAAQSGSGAAGGATGSSSSAGGGTSGAAAASTTPTSANPQGTSTAISIPGAAVSISVTPTGGAASPKAALSDIAAIPISLINQDVKPKPDAKAKSSGKVKAEEKVKVKVIADDQPNNAVDIATQLAGVIPQVIGIIPVSNSELVFLVDLSKKPEEKKTTSKGGIQKPEEKKTTSKGGSEKPNEIGSNLEEIKTYIENLVRPLARHRQSVAGASAGKPTQVEVYVENLEFPKSREGSSGNQKQPLRPNNAADIAAALAGWPQVISVTPVTDSTLVFIVDTSPKTGSSVPQDSTPLKLKIDEVIGRLQAFKYPLATRWFAVDVDFKKGNTVDIASKLAANSIPGILSIIPVGNARILFLLDTTADPRFPTKPRDLAALESEIEYAVKNLEWGFPTIYVVPFALGFGKNCDVANALVRQIPGVLNISPVGTTRLAFTIDPRIRGKKLEYLESNIATLVSSLGEPVTAPLPNTQMYSQQLYYNHDPTTLASIVTAAFPEVKASAIVPDKIVLSETLPPGFDPKQKHDPLQDARRLVSILDQPRSQLSLEAWSFQVSAKNSQDIEAISQTIQGLSFEYNRILADSIAAARAELYHQQHPSSPGEEYWDVTFRNYLRDQAFATPQQCCQLSNDLEINPDKEGSPSDGYALGYRKLFDSPPSGLIYMLVALAASTQPLRNADYVINLLEGKPEKATVPSGEGLGASQTCQKRDRTIYEGYLGGPKRYEGQRWLQLECVRDVLHDRLFEPNTPALGAFRAAIADFLYQYKMMVLYSDSFEPYLASRAAATLDAQLGPVVDAFSNDLLILEQTLVKEFERTPVAKGAKKKGEQKADRCTAGIAQCRSIAYATSGIVSFKTVTGVQSNVQTTTQNYFNATPPVTLGDLAAAIKSIGSPTATSNGTPVPAALPQFLTANMTANEAVGTLAALQVLNRAPVVAKIGKGLNLTAEAYSSPGASGAELNVTVQSNENGAGQVTAPTATNEVSVAATTDDLASRVAQHQVTTRVRVSSLNLFSLSTMQSVLARGQAPWKILDPLVEIPLLSEVVKKPRVPELIYHRSFVFLNAMLVPTAIDLGWGVTIEPDMVRDANSVYRPARSLDDLFASKMNGNQPDEEFGRVKRYHEHLLELFRSQEIQKDGAVTPIDEQNLPRMSKMIRIDESGRSPSQPVYGKQVPQNMLASPSKP